MIDDQDMCEWVNVSSSSGSVVVGLYCLRSLNSIWIDCAGWTYNWHEAFCSRTVSSCKERVCGIIFVDFVSEMYILGCCLCKLPLMIPDTPRWSMKMFVYGIAVYGKYVLHVCLLVWPASLVQLFKKHRVHLSVLRYGRCVVLICDIGDRHL